MYVFEYASGLYQQDIDSIINLITKELSIIRKNKKNLVKFAYSESIKGKLIFLDFQRIINEIQRMSLEIEFLENKMNHYIETKEKQQRQ